MRSYALLTFCLFLLLSSFVFQKAVASQNAVSGDFPGDFNIEEYKDPTPLGGAYLLDNRTYTVEIKDCRIEWEVSEFKERPGEYTLYYRSASCSYPMQSQIPVHRKILKEIFSDYDKAKFYSLGNGSFGRKKADDWSWSIPIAMASSQSDDWEDYRKNYPNCKKRPRCRSTNDMFVEFANATDAYKPLRILFEEFGLVLRLEAVEKVFAQKAEELPFYQQLNQKELQGNPRLIYDCGMSWFVIKPK